MSRRRREVKRKILPDTKYNDIIVAKFINTLMEQGKKAVAQKIFYTSIELFKEKLNRKDELEAFKEVLEKVKPQLEVKPRRVGGSTYQIPIEVKGDRQMTLVIRWLINAAKNRNGHSMAEKLSAEFIDAFNNRGGALKKKDDVHKMAEANRAYTHYIW